MDAADEQNALRNDSVAGSSAPQKSKSPLREVFATAGRWGLGWWAFFWFEFFCAAMLAMANGAWRSLALEALKGATSFNFVLVMTAFNVAMILMVAFVLSPKRAQGWAGWELNILKLSAEAGVALTMFGMVATVAIMAMPSLDFTIGRQAALLFVCIPALATLINILLHVLHDEALDSGKVENARERTPRQHAEYLASWLVCILLMSVVIWRFPVVVVPVAASHMKVTKALEDHLLGKRDPEECDAARKQGVSEEE
ncbi:hypothetical protein [Stenotrophomonas maltophilia]|uniref:hypothetical protein n=1 Tax=Stenotrophomonas maltophilia TaxID=40324 RepID=UPI0039F6EB34